MNAFSGTSGLPYCFNEVIVAPSGNPNSNALCGKNTVTKKLFYV